jgi:hypothetical protein
MSHTGEPGYPVPAVTLSSDRKVALKCLQLGGALSVARCQALWGLVVGTRGLFKVAWSSPPGGAVPDPSGEHMATSTASWYRRYRSRTAGRSDVTTWAQIDLGSCQNIDTVKLYPYTSPHAAPGEGFPLCFRIECSDDADFKLAQLIADRSQIDYPDPGDSIVQFATREAKGRYLRLTVTRLRAEKGLGPFDDPKQCAREAPHFFALAKIEVISGGADPAVHRP